MNIEIANFIWSLVGSLGLGAALAVFISWFFLPGYLSEKGKNLATKEDIAKITEEIEKVKIRYTMSVEQYKANHQLRLAALDKRLHAHQEAFVFWRKLVAHAYHENIGMVVLEVQEWWEKNCLYLEPQARQAMSDAYIYAGSHRSLVAGGAMRRDDAYVAQIKDSWSHVIGAGEIILKAVELPPLTSQEIKALVPEIPEELQDAARLAIAQ